MDAGAHAFLGLSGALLDVVANWFPAAPGGGPLLPPYPSLRLAIVATVAGALLHALLPASTVGLAAWPRRTNRVRNLSVLVALAAFATSSSRPLAAAALPGVLASLVLLAGPPRRSTP